MRTDLLQRIAALRTQRIAQQRSRVRHAVTRREGVRHEIDGRWLIGFCSNDYLGLSQQFSAVAALQDAAARHGIGSTGSHLARTSRRDEAWNASRGWSVRARTASAAFHGHLAVRNRCGADDICVPDRLNHPSLSTPRISGLSSASISHADPRRAAQLTAVPKVVQCSPPTRLQHDWDGAPCTFGLAARMQHSCCMSNYAHCGLLAEQTRQRGRRASKRVRCRLQLVTLGKALGGYGAGLVGTRILTRTV